MREQSDKIIYLLNFDKSKTLYENNQIFCLKQIEILEEQSGIDWKSAEIISRGSQPIVNWIKTWDKHDWMTFIDVTSTLLSSIPGPQAPFFMGLALTASLTDAIMYGNEGDIYMAGIVLAFSVIPAGDLVKYLRKTSKLGAKGAINTLKAVKSGTATKEELKTAKEIIEEFGENSEKIAKLTKINLVKNFLNQMGKVSLKVLIGTVVLLIHSGKAVGKLGLTLWGIYYLYDEIYLALTYLYDDENKKYEKLRYNSRFQGLVRLLKSTANLQSVQDQALEFLKLHEKTFQDNSELLSRVDTTKNSKELEELEINLQKKIEDLNTKKSTPSIDDVLYGKIGPSTNKEFVIEKGMKGKPVYYIQQKLSSLGSEYSQYLKNFDNSKNPLDSIFGENTETAVYIFQENNKIKPTGVVDKITLTLLNKQSNKEKK